MTTPAPATRKPILCLDFDGVIHSYDSGWTGADQVPDDPVPGALDFIVAAARHFDVQIYSSRSIQTNGIGAMQQWLTYHLTKHQYGPAGVEYLVYKIIKWPTSKPPAMVSIDDRAITFTGTWPSIEDLVNFTPWNKPAAPKTASD